MAIQLIRLENRARANAMPKSENSDYTAQLKRLFAERLVAAMAKPGALNGVQLAAKLGVEGQIVTDYRKGRALPGFENFVKLLEALGEPSGWFIGRMAQDDSLDALSRRLGARLGKNLLAALTHVDDETLVRTLEHAIGASVAASGALPPAPTTPKKRQRRSK